MSYDRFSSWSNEIEPDQPEEPVSPSPEPVQPSSDLSAEDILSDLEALDSGESYEAEVGLESIRRSLFADEKDISSK